MSGKPKRKSKLKNKKRRYYFFLNPYEDCAFTRCPKCENKTKVRKFPLVIHIDPIQMLVLNITCKFCPYCDLIILKQSKLETYMTAAFQEHNPEIIGNDYLVMGTIERKDWRENQKREVTPSETIERMYVFKDHWNFELAPPGWYPEDEE